MDKKRILIVDDDKGMVEVLTVWLEAKDYEVIKAHEGPEGLEKAQKEMPDLIILDLMLPRMDGYTVCRMLKYDDKYKKIPIVMLTGRDQESDKKLGKDMGVDAYLTKPFDSKILLEKIAALLEKK